MRQILGWSVLVRIDDLTYSFLGDVDPDLVNGTVSLKSMFFAIGPTYTLLSGHAGPMQVNLTFHNPIEVCCHRFVTSMSTSYTPSKARRLGQTVHPILVHVFHHKLIRRRRSSCAGVFRCQRRYVQSCSEACRFFSASLQSGSRGIERNRFYGPRRSIPTLSSTVSDSRTRKNLLRYSTERNGVHYIMP
jgi:hypothetical protein